MHKEQFTARLDDALFVVLILCASVAAAAMEVAALSGAFRATTSGPHAMASASSSAAVASASPQPRAAAAVLLTPAAGRDPR